MSRVSDATTQERKDRVLSLLRQEGELNENEIATHLNLDRRTVNNYLRDLDYDGKVEKEGVHWRLSSLRALVPRKLTLDAEQAVILYLAIRLFVKQSDRRVETAETLLMNLANIVTDDLGAGSYFSQAATELGARPEDEAHHDTLRILARALIQKRKVEIVYEPYRGHEFRTIFSPYLLEPSGIGFATYVIGHSSIVGKLRTYKVERIHSARLLRDSFEIPDTFPGLDLLKNAFSIYYGDDITEVVLRFSPEVARRVQETNWRTATASQPDPEKPNHLRLTFHVADTTDLKPWIRTWGANVEVLAPAALRDEMVGEARALATLYGWHVTHVAPDGADPLDLKDSLARLMNKRPHNG